MTMIGTLKEEMNASLKEISKTQTMKGMHESLQESQNRNRHGGKVNGSRPENGIRHNKETQTGENLSEGKCS